jgi:hypothetical protein
MRALKARLVRIETEMERRIVRMSSCFERQMDWSLSVVRWR